jgi:hypothetical protein
MLASSKWFPFILIFVGIMLVIAAFAFPAFSNAKNTAGEVPVPNQIGSYSLGSKATGIAAIQEFTRLHGKPFSVLAGAKANYGSGNQVTLWVASTASIADTSQLLEAMRDKIADDKSPFTPAGSSQDKGRTVFALDGMGQKHFYFQSGKYLVWMAANADLADFALQQILTFYP